MDTEKFEGILKREIFKGDSGYLIATIEDNKTEEERIIVGYMTLLPNQLYIFNGEEKEHEKYGLQYQIISYEIKIPKKEESIIEFLSSTSFKNIGKRTAKKIVDNFGLDAVEIIKNNPEKLQEIGISENNIDTLYNNLSEYDGMEDIYKLLNPLGFSEFYINEIYRYLKTNKINIPKEFIKNNPYKLSENIDGITFLQADKIFLYYNDDLHDEYRVENSILYTIKNMCYQLGDTYVLKENLNSEVEKLLNFKVVNFAELLEKLSNEKKIILDQEKVSLKEFYNAEKAIARNIINRINFLNLGLEEDILEPNIGLIEKEKKINYSSRQKEAIKNSLMNNISIITGGPGTGKTTIIEAIIKIFEKIKYKNQVIKHIEDKIILCAPTGRAAQRMKESTGYKAKTIHSLLEWDPYKNEFNRTLEAPLIQELIIIDEFSMVDIFLAEAIFKAIRPNSIIVIIGDSAQLESVNPGNVLEDLIQSKIIPTVHLDFIFRQDEGSSIALLAKSIDENQKIEIINTKDMSMINRKIELPELVKSVVNKSYEAGYNDMDIQVLYPKYSGKNGIDNLNEMLLPNLQEDFILFGNKKYYLNDKVMQLKNNYEKNIYNGDIGKVTQIYKKSKEETNQFLLEVTFKDQKVNFNRKDLIDLTHAYAISIHKSQGSEFKVIILPISSEAQKMLNKKLLYTAITRAKDKLIIIGEMDYFINNLQKENTRRKTLLQEFLKV